MQLQHNVEAKFSLGQLVATNNFMLAIHQSGDKLIPYILEHVQGRWGDLSKHDWNANEYALKHGLRLLSVYYLSDGTKFWIITEADRSSTTVLLPSDY